MYIYTYIRDFCSIFKTYIIYRINITFDIYIYIYLYKIKPPYRRYDFYITMTIAPCPGESYDEAEVAWSFQPGDEARPEESQSLARACCELASGFLRQMILPGSNWIPLAIDFHPLGFHVLWDGWFPNAIMPLLISFFWHQNCL